MCGSVRELSFGAAYPHTGPVDIQEGPVIAVAALWLARPEAVK